MTPSDDVLVRETVSEEQTGDLALALAGLLRAGDALSLSGTLGAGKTRFAQGLALGLGVPEDVYVTSPTFTIINQYACSTPTFEGAFFHLDLYRLEEPDELMEIGYYDLLRGDGIVAVEWWDNFPEEIPQHTLHVRLAITGPEARRITFASADPSWAARLAPLAGSTP